MPPDPLIAKNSGGRHDKPEVMKATPPDAAHILRQPHD
jgi:hypothetical protein